jgi:hypothetical protein
MTHTSVAIVALRMTRLGALDAVGLDAVGLDAYAPLCVPVPLGTARPSPRSAPH